MAAWLLNLTADPSVVVDVDGARHPATADVLDGEERDAAWQTVRRALAGLEEAAAACSRRIPIVRLTAV